MTHGDQRDGTGAPPPVDHAAWGARFGWILGALVGLVAGFAATYALELWVLRSAGDPTRAASRASSVLVPALFVAGALAGHAFGAKGGAARYRLLAMGASVAALVTAWLGVVFLRR